MHLVKFFFVVSVLSVYNVCLACLVPWRCFEINVVEFVFILLLIVLLTSVIAFVDPTDKINEFESVFSLMFVLILCVGIMYILRVCFAFVVGPKQKFESLPKPTDISKLVQCLKILFERRLSDATIEQIIGNMPDHELAAVQFFFGYSANCKLLFV